MKKLLYLFVLLLFNFTLKAQFPIQQNIGNDSTLLRIGANSKGAIRGSLIPSTYVDTQTANAGRIDDYPFAIIGTSGDGNVWQRNYLGTGWVRLGGGTSPSGSFWNVGGNLLPVYPTPYARIGTLTPYGGAISLMTNSVDRLVIPDGGIVRSSAAVNKFLMMDTTTNIAYYGDGGGGAGGSVPVDSLTQWGLDIRDYANVYHGIMYPLDQTFYKFFWQVLAMPYPNCYYWISDDNGGRHNILFGNDGSSSGMMGITGNVYYDLTQTSFTGHDVVPDSTIHFFGVGYDGANIVTFVDGVPSKATAYTGYRRRNSGTGGFWIGGSDHSKAVGVLYEIVGFEDVCPIALGGHYYPQKGIMGTMPGCVFFSDYSTPTNLIADNSVGMFNQNHPGTRNAYGPLALPAIGNFYAANVNQYGFYDSLKPQWVKSQILPTAYSGPSATIPGSAVAYDEFLRSDRTPAWTNSVDIILDSTEGGTAGKKKWNIGAGTNIAGLLTQHAWLDVTNGGFVYVSGLGISDQDVRVTRDYGDAQLQVLARFTDNNNFVKCYYADDGNVYLNKKVAGSETIITSASAGGVPTVIRLVVSGSTADVYVNGVIKITAASITGVPLGEGAGFGVINDYGRIKKFEVY